MFDDRLYLVKCNRTVMFSPHRNQTPTFLSNHNNDISNSDDNNVGILTLA